MILIINLKMKKIIVLPTRIDQPKKFNFVNKYSGIIWFASVSKLFSDRYAKGSLDCKEQIVSQIVKFIREYLGIGWYVENFLVKLDRTKEELEGLKKGKWKK